jgi:MHS family proline/betaine transporter-like MFS transporter
MRAKNIIAGISGSILQHYDNALYALLVPFIAPLFFPNLSYLSGLIAGYGIQMIGILMQPVGAMVFGYIGDRKGRKHALFLTIMGMSLTTLLLGCLPTYASIGEASPFILLLLRGLQNFFAGGEIKGAAIFILEHGQGRWRGFLSSLYDSSTILGIFCASGAVALLSHFGLAENYWRYLFFFGAVCGSLGFFFRFYCEESLEFSSEKTLRKGFIASLWKHKKAIVFIALASGFSYVTYAIPFTLMNGFLPLISSITKAEAVEMNTSLLFLDMIVLPLFGMLSRYVSYEKIMKSAVLALIVLAIPLFSLLVQATSSQAILVRTVIVLLGVAFAAPLHQWTLDIIPVKERYLVASFASSLGSQLFGAPCAAICLWLFQTTGWIIAPAFYLLITGFGAFFALLFAKTSLRDPSNKAFVLK